MAQWNAIKRDVALQITCLDDVNESAMQACSFVPGFIASVVLVVVVWCAVLVQNVSR